jgi:hypothetical protein
VRGREGVETGGGRCGRSGWAMQEAEKGSVAVLRGWRPSDDASSSAQALVRR